MKSFAGAFIDTQPPKNVGDEPILKYVQNLTIDNSFNNAPVLPGETFTLAEDFFAFTSIEAPKTYRLQLAVFYSDEKYEYSNVVYDDETVRVLDNAHDVNIVTGILSLIFTLTFLFLFLFVIYVKVSDRFFP